MSYRKTVSLQDAEGAVREMYERQQAHWGYVPNYAKSFSHRPEVMARWGRLLAEIRRPLDDRTFELVTFAAALALWSRGSPGVALSRHRRGHRHRARGSAAGSR